MERSESPEVEVEQKEDGSFVTHSHLSIKATSIALSYLMIITAGNIKTITTII